MLVQSRICFPTSNLIRQLRLGGASLPTVVYSFPLKGLTVLRHMLCQKRKSLSGKIATEPDKLDDPTTSCFNRGSSPPGDFPVAMSCPVSRQNELTRQREAFRYDAALIVNSTSNCTANLIPSKTLTTSADSTLTALCQLAVLRLSASRALVSLFDQSNQIVVAEATPQTRLLPNCSSKHQDQNLWLCGTRFHRSFGVCERVILASTNQSPRSQQLPVTVINDLAADESLCDRPYCHAWPHNRFYAGVPLITPRGIAIGTLCVFDSQPRSGLDESSKSVLRDLAQSVMSHLEERRASERYRQAGRVTRGIRRFFNRPNTKSEMKSDQLLAAEPRLRTPGADFSPRMNHGDSRPSDDTLANICASAADVMRDSLEVDSVLILDASHTHRGQVGKSRHGINKPNSSEDHSPKTHRGLTGADDLCPVLGSSLSAETEQAVDSYFGPPTLRASVLKKMLRYYPRGAIWTSDYDDNETSEKMSDDSSSDSFNQSSSSEGAGRAPGQHHSRQKLRQELRQAVFKLVPGATGVAFFPMWNAQKRRWFAGGFAYSNSATRVFSAKRELSYLRAFGTVLMAEVSFLKEREVDRSKLDVLDSISHELRSPLHGILLGAGLVRGGRLDSTQDDALLTVEACSRTLLDTIDQILDWSKVNHFDTSPLKVSGDTPTDRSNRTRQRSQSDNLETGSMSIATDVDLPLLIEDVIESVTMGHEFQRLSFEQTKKLPDTPSNRVKIIVNFVPAPGANWMFNVQAGAIRRIVLNLFGNSLKFTSSGFVYIQVEQSETRDSSIRSVRLTIADTGCGISQEYLTNYLFSPFTQQNIIDAGTGLGLSLVRRIANSLDGTIEVQSEVSVGTTVRVTLPLKSSNERSEFVDAADLDSLNTLPTNPDGFKISLLGFQDSSVENNHELLLDNPPSEKESISSVCEHWLGLSTVEVSGSLDETTNALICDYGFLDKAKLLTKNDKSTPLIVICQNAAMARKQQAIEAANDEQHVVFTHEPLGPRKLQRILARFMKNNQTGTPSSGGQPATDKCPQLLTPASATQHVPPIPPTIEGENRDTLGSTLPETCLTQQRPRSSLPTPSAETEPTIEETSNKGNLFLLVDDNPINLKMLIVFMKKLKLTYCTATDGQQALDIYVKNPESFRCVFMDISMPVMNGFEATRAIRVIEANGSIRRCPIFALTGLASRDAQQEAILSGIDLFLIKPTQLKKIKHVLESNGLLG
ncbi:ATPase-like, ATP-binding domain protein [Fusarium austroafricanum]|uniref:ATPase-like, ATP-binding domain protein n=1 Tax=Fusarium austroafricanum TaxID=2364996 RepID=A0A8H4JJG7_9HYPO|nr:ATPase-like, ATP-binding domain protein [Fusarium austroafricanum]